MKDAALQTQNPKKKISSSSLAIIRERVWLG